MENSHPMATGEHTVPGSHLSTQSVRKPLIARAISRAVHALLRVGTRNLNPFMLSFARNRRVSAFAVVHHQGRRSGRAYATPLSARPTEDGFVIPLTFGEQADWFRNIQAAGQCLIQWKGVNYPVVDPVMVDRASVRSVFSPLERVMLSLIGVDHLVRLKHAPASDK